MIILKPVHTGDKSRRKRRQIVATRQHLLLKTATLLPEIFSLFPILSRFTMGQKSGLCLNTSLFNIHELSTYCHRFRRQCCRFGHSGRLLPFSATIASATICRRFRQLLLPVWTGYKPTVLTIVNNYITMRIYRNTAGGHCNFSSIFTRFRDTTAFVLQHATFSHPTSSLPEISPCSLGVDGWPFGYKERSGWANCPCN